MNLTIPNWNGSAMVSTTTTCYRRWAAELLHGAHRAFAYPAGAPQRMYWRKPPRSDCKPRPATWRACARGGGGRRPLGEHVDVSRVLQPLVPLAAGLEDFWLDPLNQAAATWTGHREGAIA